jgi:prolyl oligopeptidase
MSRSVFALALALVVGCPAPRDTTSPDGGIETVVTQDPRMQEAGPPNTRKDDVVDTIHGQKVADPYRWLEDVASPDVKAWMDQQDAFARGELVKLPLRAELEKRLTELSYLDTISAPYHRGERWFYSRSHRDKEKDVYYVKKGEQGPEQVLIDPNTLSDDGSVSVHGIMPSYSGRHVAYKLSRNNADASTMYVRNLETGKDLPDVIEGAKYAYASWTPDDKGFYYTWLPTDPAISPSELPGYAEVRFHALGTDPKSDTIVFPASGDPTRFTGVQVSRDGRWLFVTRSRGSVANDVYVKDLKAKPKKTRSKTPTKTVLPAGFVPFVEGQDAIYGVSAWKDKFYVFTNEGAPRFRLFSVDPKKQARTNWKEIVPETEATLDGTQIVGDHLVLSYLHNAHSEMELRDLNGKLVRKVELPGLGSSGGMVGNPDEDDAYFYYSSFTETPQIYKTSIASGKTTLWEKIVIPVDTSNFTTDQVWYTSKDGTNVSMFVVHNKDVELNGDNPTLLYGYGGFSVNMEPAFSARVVMWLEHGGVYAVPNLRGGGEYGEAWHRAGMLERKQNVFDDYIGAAEWLVKNNWTRPDKLAIYGGSNGGLLVGAAMTQRPDLYKAVVCAVPLLDMVRYHLSGSGKTWIVEYGSADDPKQFEAIFAYSPYHRVKPDTKYPAMLMLTADSDDRVDPMHARKFTAAIQAATTGEGPTLMRIEKNAGHGGSDMTKREIEQGVDVYAFLMHQLGMKG